MVGLHCLAEALLGGSHCRVEVILVHIAQGHHAAALVALEVEIATAYATHTYDASCELVTRSHIVVGSPHLAQHLAGKDGEECRRGCCSLQETSSVYSHVVLGLYMLLLCIAFCESVRLLSACCAVGCGFWVFVSATLQDASCGCMLLACAHSFVKVTHLMWNGGRPRVISFVKPCKLLLLAGQMSPYLYIKGCFSYTTTLEEVQNVGFLLLAPLSFHKAHCGAMAGAARCVGRCSALRWLVQCAALFLPIISACLPAAFLLWGK